MKPLDMPPMPPALGDVRSAGPDDREHLSNLIQLEAHVHRHLDWKPALDWIGKEPFIVLEDDSRIVGALACPPDPESIGWLRLFVFASHLSGEGAWQLLWSAACRQLEIQACEIAAAIVTQPWLEPILKRSGFELLNHIVLMEMNIGSVRPARDGGFSVIREMLPSDLPRVADLDAQAFDPLWRNSLDALSSALKQASYASVAQDGPDLVGYQLSTGGPFGTHLARLAVLPALQRQGLGAALVNDLIEHIPRDREPRITVNTQSDNSASHALYARLGFRRTGERFPVYVLQILGGKRSVPESGGVH
jgi:ribosomal protein S18 acetylase RimI-like enzyme